MLKTTGVGTVSELYSDNHELIGRTASVIGGLLEVVINSHWRVHRAEGVHMIHSLTGVVTVLTLLGLAAGPAAAFTHTSSHNETALSGHEIYLYGGSSLNPDCSIIGGDNLRVISGPSHGDVRILHGKVFAHFAKNNERSRCNSRKVEGIKALYRSKPGFKGWDQVTLSVHTYTGNAFNAVVNIKVE